jgi:hypothetical protein
VLCEQNHVEAFRLLVYDRRFGLGVSEERVYRTYRIDSDFFEEGELLFGLDHQGRSVAAHAAAIMNAPSS